MKLITFIKKIFKSEYKLPTNNNVRRFDCSKNFWGHACHLDNDTKTIVDNEWVFFDVSGHLTPIPRVGDEVIISMASGKAAVFVFTEVEPCRDPKDMYFGKVVGIGYLEDVSPRECTTEFSATSQIAPLREAGHSNQEIAAITGLTPPGGTE